MSSEKLHIKVSQICEATFFAFKKICSNFDKTLFGLNFGRIFSQTHLVTLPVTLPPTKGFFSESSNPVTLIVRREGRN
jgi:hypothetical protein